MIIFRDLSRFSFSNAINRIESGVFSQDSGDEFQSITESSHSVLFNRWDFIGFLLKRDGAGEFGGSSSVYNSWVFDQVSNNTKGIMQWSNGFIHNHSTSSSNKNGDGFENRAVFNDKHFFVGSSELEFSNGTGFTKFFGSDFLKSGDNSGSSGHSEEFDISSSNPSNSGEFVL